MNIYIALKDQISTSSDIQTAQNNYEITDALFSIQALASRTALSNKNHQKKIDEQNENIVIKQTQINMIREETNQVLLDKQKIVMRRHKLIPKKNYIEEQITRIRAKIEDLQSEFRSKNEKLRLAKERVLLKDKQKAQLQSNIKNITGDSKDLLRKLCRDPAILALKPGNGNKLDGFMSMKPQIRPFNLLFKRFFAGKDDISNLPTAGEKESRLYGNENIHVN